VAAKQSAPSLFRAAGQASTPSRGWLLAPWFAARRQLPDAAPARRGARAKAASEARQGRRTYKYRTPMAASGFPLLPAPIAHGRGRRVEARRDGLLPPVTPRAGLLARPWTPPVRCCSLAPAFATPGSGDEPLSSLRF
jgi:hypothetical protein